jgi:ssDNA-binding Zn-finger/Zn-ribbon topoisomerase 1
VITHPNPKGPEYRWLYAEIDKGLPLDAEIIQKQQPPIDASDGSSFFFFGTSAGNDQQDSAPPRSGVLITIRMFVLPCESPTAPQTITPSKKRVARSNPMSASSKEDKSFRFSCPHCTITLTAQEWQIGNHYTNCPFCEKRVMAPAPAPDRGINLKAPDAHIEPIGKKTFRWVCPKCNKANNTRKSSIGTLIRCKYCKLEVDFAVK